MNKFLTKSILSIAVILLCNLLSVSAQATVDPNANGVNLFCFGESMSLTLPSTAGLTWKLMFSATQTTMPTITIAMTNGAISAADTRTGYYYLSSKSNDPNACESEMQEIPVYVLQPLNVAFTAKDFCIDAATPQKGIVTSTDAKTQVFAYQWYTVSNGVESRIDGAIDINYTPTAVGKKFYRLRAGYLIGNKKYCPAFVDQEVTVTAKPAKPTITPTEIRGTTGDVTF